MLAVVAAILASGTPTTARADRLGVTTPGKAAEVRERLQRFIWGGGLPRQAPGRVEQSIFDSRFIGLANLERIERLTVGMDLGFSSIVYRLVPRRSNGRVVLYHNGHGQNVGSGARIAAYFLERGYGVFNLAMPLAGENRYPARLRTRCGVIGLRMPAFPWAHERMACLPRPFRFFVEPVVVTVNYARRLGYRSIAMVGLSGGGWTTVLAAALDPRIRHSFPVAGSAPTYTSAVACARSPNRLCLGDFEQRHAPLYRVASYLELYVLGSWGRGRSQLAVYNVYDPCCFAGEQFKSWEPSVRRALRRVGSGSFDAFGDRSHSTHSISPLALSLIAKRLRG